MQHCNTWHSSHKQWCWDLGSMQTGSKAIFCRWVLEIDPDAAYETVRTRCSFSTGGRVMGEPLIRVLVAPLEMVQSEQQAKSNENTSGELRVCISHSC